MTSAAFLLVALTHLGHWPLHALTGIEATLWFYVLRGVSGSVVWWWARGLRPSAAWRVLCSVGAAFEGLTALCGVAYMLRPVAPAMWEGLADSQTGLPLLWVDLVVFAVLALIIGEKKL